MEFSASAVLRCRILVVGDVMLDRYWFGEVERISPEAPVPVVHVARREDRLGGAANVARNVAALGAQVTLLGIVGDDEAGEHVRILAQEAGVHADLLTSPQHPTTLKMRLLGRQQQLLRVDFEQPPPVSALDALDGLMVKYLAEHDIIVMSDYAKGTLARVSSQVTP